MGRDNFSAESDYILQRLANQTNTAEGPNTPPRLIGGINRVPIVTALKINLTQGISNNTLFTVTWLNPDNQQAVDHYNIYVNNTTNPTGTATSPVIVPASPAFVTVNQTIPNSRVIITVQTVLKNGMVSALSSSPSVVGIANSTVYSGTVISNGLAATPSSLNISYPQGGPNTAVSVLITYNLANTSITSVVNPAHISSLISGSNVLFFPTSTAIGIGTYTGTAVVTTPNGDINVPITLNIT